MHFDSATIQTLFYIVAAFAAVVVVFLRFKAGEAIASSSHRRVIASREQELFTAQKGFKTLYENEVNNLGAENVKLKAQIDALNQKVEDYRRKASGFGGMFSNTKRAEAMYALLLENESLEEALHIQ